MKTIFPYIVILLMAGLVWYQCQSAKTEQFNSLASNARLQTKVTELNAVAQTAADSINAIHKIREVSDSVHRVSEIALKREIGKHKKTIGTLRPMLASLDSLPDIKDYIQEVVEPLVIAQDSTIHFQDSLIFTLNRQMDSRSKSFQDEVVQLQTANKAEHDIGLVYMEQHLASQQEVKKEKKKVKLWKIIGGGLAAVIVYLSVK